ncbi:Legume lectin domain-containing protein [Enterococcus malodoratus]|uniref:lectin-like domain-containing protein n=1 Tax=Enterococcus malodoratus TaxID=71451 RepID=UPI0008BC61DA|nr:MucBP domain-containing protein [Enterococcus malodoratus]SES95981.1 Legume lectin domain-containing protein [Enterococcus malodoratus]
MAKKKILILIASGLLSMTSFSIISEATTVSSTKLQTSASQSTEQSQIEETSESTAVSESFAVKETDTSDLSETAASIDDLPQSGKTVKRSAAPFAADLPQDPNIIPIDKVFQNPIGNSTSILEDGKLLQLNPAQKSQKGAIWSKKPISLLSDFTFKSYLYLGDQRGSAGDGMTFTLTNDPRMENDATQVIGSSGMGIGAYSTKSGEPYIRNGLSIEFDTYKNQGSSDRMDREISGDNSGRGHVAFVTPKENNNNYDSEHTGVTVAPTYLSDGTWRMLTVHWNAGTKQLSYDLEGIGSSSKVITDLNATFGGSTVYWGFTSSTGGKYQENALAMTQIPSSVKSTAELSVNDTGFETEAEANKEDIVTLKNTLHIDNDLKSHRDFADEHQPQMSINLPSELAYEQGSLKIDGIQASDKDIIVAGTRITLDLTDYLVLEKDMVIELKTKLQDSTPEKRLAMNFEYLENGALLQKSNEIAVKIAKPKEKTITVFYQDAATNQEVAPSKQLTGKIGDHYKETPPAVAGFVFKNDSGNAEGTFSETTQDIYFYFRPGELYFMEAPKQIVFGSHKISTTALVKFGTATEGLRIMDERATNKWQVQLKQTQPLTDGTVVMPDVLSFVTDSQSDTISDAAITISEGDQKGETNLSGLLDADQQRGIKITVPVEYQRLGTFKGALSWTLTDVPGN